ncbi:MAG: PqqD family protein [Clostridia bacterium]|nr:PqqD family protein [Clostridia bacterium]
MKAAKDYVVREIAGDVVIVPTGKAAQQFNGLITANSVAGFVWLNLEKCDTPQEMVELVLENYEVEREVAQEQILSFLQDMKTVGMIEY